MLNEPLRYDLFFPLVFFLHHDVLDSESIPAGSMRLFLDGIVQRFAPEHASRIFQQLFVSEVIAPALMAANLEDHAWRSERYSDVTFKVRNPESGEAVTFLAHKAIVRFESWKLFSYL